MTRIHVDPSTLNDILDGNARVRVFSAADPNLVMAEGTLIGYCGSPSVMREHADGVRSSWSVNLPMETIEEPAAAATVTRVFTFGWQQRCPITGIDLVGRYALVTAADVEACERAMNASLFGRRWALSYATVDAAAAPGEQLVEHAQVAADGTVKLTPHNVPAGPYENAEDTHDSPLFRELDDSPRGSVPVVVERHLLEACRNADVKLGDFDFRTLSWFGRLDAETAQSLIGLISRAYAAGKAAPR